MKSKVALALLVLAASIVLSACGGSQEEGLASSTPTGPRAPRNGRPPRTDPKKGCDAQGVNSTQLYPGACTEQGIQYVVANYGGVVRLRTLAVTITGVGVSGGYQGGGRVVAPANDAFLRVSLQVQNLDKKPHRFGFGQTMLGIGANNYLERIDIERRVHQEAIAKVNGGQLGPGESLRGDVLFDVTEVDYQELQRRGRFFIWNFGDRAEPQLGRGIQVGQIRLYAGEPGQEAPQAG
ncbi:MAG TPA: hypothetical protein VFS37_07070 [Conexibacter sp.]|nr:hypothetical protein [Conexibacter sp.]